MKKILIFEKDSFLLSELKKFFTHHNYYEFNVLNSLKNLEAYIHSELDLITINLDIDNSIEIAKTIRVYTQSPIIFYTNYNCTNIIDTILNIKNCYLVSFSNIFKDTNFLFIVKKLLFNKKVYLNKEFMFDKEKNQLYKKNKPIKLTNKELKLFKLFLENQNKLISNETIEHFIWDKPINSITRIALISKLKSKLEGNFIQNIPKQGYIFLTNF